MKCANCGAEIKLGCVYCSVCGKEAQIVPDYNVEEDILKELSEMEIASMTPLEALNTLNRLQSKLKNRWSVTVVQG